MSDTLYGKCTNCGEEFETEEASEQHMKDTLTPVADPSADPGGAIARSHTVSRLRLTEAEKLDQEVFRIVERAIDSAMGRLDNLGVSEEEISGSLASYPDFLSAWEEYIE